MSYDPSFGSAPAPPTLAPPAGDPAALHSAADRLAAIATIIDEAGSGSVAALLSIPRWHGPGRDAAMASIARLGAEIPAVGDALRAGATATHELAAELAAAQGEVAVAQQLAFEIAALAARAVIPTNDLFNQVLGAARASSGRAEAARQRAIARWAAASPGGRRTPSAPIKFSTTTASRGLFTAIGRALLTGADLGAPGMQTMGAPGFAPGFAGWTDPSRRPGWDGGIDVFGWSPPRRKPDATHAGTWDLDVKGPEHEVGRDLLDKDGPTRGKHARNARQTHPGRWPKDRKGPEGFVGWKDSYERGEHISRDTDGAITHDVFVGSTGDYQVGVTAKRDHVFVGAEANVQAGSTNSVRATWDPRYGGADAGASTFVGARAGAGVSAGFDTRRNEGRVHAGVDAFAGAEAKADVGGNVGGVGGRGGVTGYAGIGAKADADVRLKGGKFKARVELGAAFGLGLGGNVSVEVDVDKAKRTAHDAAEGISDGAKKAGGWLNPFD